MGRIAEQCTPARVLVWDIETRPPISMHWGTRDQYISPEQMFDMGGMIAWSAQWLGETKVRFMSDHHDGHEDMVRGLHALLSACDVSVGFNHERFDHPHHSTEMELLDLPALPPIPTVDLLKVVRKNFRLPHNKLSAVAKHFGLADKMSNDGWQLWRCCITDTDGRPYLAPVPKGGGCPTHWKQMRKYAVTDTRVTTELYHHLVAGGWIKRHPHAALFGAPLDGCPTCGSTQRTATKPVTLSTGVYPGWRCSSCRSVYRGVRRLNTAPTTRAV
jgi:hypothetical protein